MRVSHAILATLVSLTMSACTTSKRQPVIVPDSSLKPKVGQAAGQNNPSNTSVGGGIDVTAPAADGTTISGAPVAPAAGGTVQTNPDAGPSTVITSPDGTTAPATGSANPPASGGASSGNASASAANGGTAAQPSAQAGSGKTRLNDLTVSTPAGFSVVQQAQAEGVTLVGFAKGDDFAALYSKSGGGMTTQGIFVNGSKVVTPEATKKVGNYDWKMIETTMTVERGLPHAGTYFVTGFLMEKGGVTYYGYGKSTSADNARAAAQAVLSAVE